MSSNEIGTKVLFKKQLGLNYEIDQKYVGLKMKENNILSFNFRVPGELKDEVEAYFRRFKLGEPILVDIGGTGDIKCDFKGISPVLKNKDEFDQYFISATLQEDKTYDPIEEEKCETCSGCGFHYFFYFFLIKNVLFLFIPVDFKVYFHYCRWLFFSFLF